MSTSNAVHLSQWDRPDSPDAPLSVGQRDALTSLSKLCECRPIPAMVTDTGKTMLTAVSSMASFPPAAPSSTASKRSDGGVAEGLMGPPRKIESGLQFLEWFHQVESQLQRHDDQHIRVGVRRHDQLSAVCQAMADKSKEGVHHVSVLEQQYKLASDGTNALNSACQQLMAEQTKMSDFLEKLASILSYFQSAERIIQKLNAPSFSVLSDVFPKILDEIDVGMTFLDQHGNYKQSRAYTVKYKAALSRALGMVRSQIKGTLENITHLSGDTSEAWSNKDAVFGSLYGKFRAQAPRLSELIRLMEEHWTLHSDQQPGTASSTALAQEYESALQDCRSVYTDCRRQLLGPAVKAAMQDLAAKHNRNHCGLVRASCAFVLHVCEDEFQLYRQFFHIDSHQFDIYLEGLCTILYDTLRPLIVQLHHLETLSELTSILRSEVLSHHILPSQDSASLEGSSAGHIQPFDSSVALLLQDVQERLVYRAYIYIQTDILGYVPHPGDLSYPEKLEMMESISESLVTGLDDASTVGNSRRKNSTSSVSSLEVMQLTSKPVQASSAGDLFGLWYPTVRRTLVCLSKLYRCLDKEIFQGLSQQALSACLVSVDKAASMISSNTKSEVDGQLFLIKHLLILREQIAPFQVAAFFFHKLVQLAVLERTLDFSNLKSAAFNLLAKKPTDMLSIGPNNALLEFLLDGATPDIKEHCRDSRKDVDRSLKQVCEAFITGVTDSVVGALNQFVSQAKLHRRDSERTNLSSLDWAKPSLLQAMVARSLSQLKKVLPKVQRSMQLYLAHRETEFILFRPIRNNMMSSFISLLHVIRANYSDDEQLIIACPSQEQLTVLMTSLMMTSSQPKPARSSVSSAEAQ